MLLEKASKAKLSNNYYRIVFSSTNNKLANNSYN